MRRLGYDRRWVTAILAAVACLLPIRVEAGDAAAASIAVSVSFEVRTHIQASSEVLRFVVTTSREPASSAIDFDAAARVSQTARVEVTVEPTDLQAFVEGSVAFEGEGLGSLRGHLSSVPAAAVRWRGGGTRRGRLVFTLTGALPGTYVVPVRLRITPAD